MPTDTSPAALVSAHPALGHIGAAASNPDLQGAAAPAHVHQPKPSPIRASRQRVGHDRNYNDGDDEDDDSATVEQGAYSVRDTAKLLGVSPATVWKLIALKKLQTVRILGCRRVPADEIKRVLTPGAA